ncbi:MAG: hypothetical protein IJ444_09005 [Kiritimatiellae bacterium]|nr:hypothetical protein [Kiritimatiellia bacterium]
MSLSENKIIQDLSLSKEEIIQVVNFFDKNINLTVLFVELFELQVSLCPDEIIFDNRETIIGFGCNNEHLRVYFRKERKSFFVKFKALDKTLPFEEDKSDVYKGLLEENDEEFEENINEFLLKGTSRKPKTQKTKKAKLKTIEENDKVLSKLSNRSNARKFTLHDFNDIADWSYCHSFTDNNKIVRLPNGNVIECDSKSEKELLKYLISKNLTKGIGAQNLTIFYDTAFRSCAEYHPDLVILTKDNHIAIIEVKSVSSMSHHINIEKYEGLKKYCEAHGYEYMMVDPDNNYMTFEDMKSMSIPKDITSRVMEYLENLLEEKYSNPCLLEKDDIDVLYPKFIHKYKKEEFLLYLRALVIQKGWYNKSKHNFDVYKKPKKSTNI